MSGSHEAERWREFCDAAKRWGDRNMNQRPAGAAVIRSGRGGAGRVILAQPGTSQSVAAPEWRATPISISSGACGLLSASFYVVNTAGTQLWLMVFDQKAVPVNGDVPLKVIGPFTTSGAVGWIPRDADLTGAWDREENSRSDRPAGYPLDLGLHFALSTTEQILTLQATALMRGPVRIAP